MEMIYVVRKPSWVPGFEHEYLWCVEHAGHLVRQWVPVIRCATKFNERTAEYYAAEYKDSGAISITCDEVNA